MRLLLFHPVVQIQACLSALNYGILNLVLPTFSNWYIMQYHESTSISGLHYIAVCIGEIAGAEIGGPLIDYVFNIMKTRVNGTSKPEFRMPIMLPAAVLTPIGLFLYGWAAQRALLGSSSMSALLYFVSGCKSMAKRYKPTSLTRIQITPARRLQRLNSYAA
jgi:hypothetical protein